MKKSSNLSYLGLIVFCVALFYLFGLIIRGIW